MILCKPAVEYYVCSSEREMVMCLFSEMIGMSSRRGSPRLGTAKTVNSIKLRARLLFQFRRSCPLACTYGSCVRSRTNENFSHGSR
jgi:hypothetical protein